MLRPSFILGFNMPNFSLCVSGSLLSAVGLLSSISHLLTNSRTACFAPISSSVITCPTSFRQNFWMNRIFAFIIRILSERTENLANLALTNAILVRKFRFVEQDIWSGSVFWKLCGKMAFLSHIVSLEIPIQFCQSLLVHFYNIS